MVQAWTEVAMTYLHAKNWHVGGAGDSVSVCVSYWRSGTPTVQTAYRRMDNNTFRSIWKTQLKDNYFIIQQQTLLKKQIFDIPGVTWSSGGTMNSPSKFQRIVELEHKQLV